MRPTDRQILEGKMEGETKERQSEGWGGGEKETNRQMDRDTKI